VVVAGDGIQVNGTGSERNPYVITSEVSEIETGIDMQYNNAVVISDVHAIDFRGSAVTVTPGVDEAIVTVTVPDVTTGAIIPSGTIWMFATGNPPSGWLLCNGDTQLIASYPNLFAVIGNSYGGDGVSTFQVPNLMDRFPIGGSATKPVGNPATGKGGSASKTIAAGNMPPHGHDMSHGHGAANTSSGGQHDHDVKLASSTGSQSTVAKGSGTWFLAAGPVNGAGDHYHSVQVPNMYGSTGSAGGGAAFDIMPPWLALAFVIKT